MIRFKTLLKLNIKRAFHSLPQLIFGATALIFLVSAVAFCGSNFLYGGLSGEASKETFSIGVVMEDTSEIADTITNAVLGMSDVNENIDFNFVSRQEAMEMLKDGKVLAAVVIPEDTVYNIIHGKNTPMTVVFPENSGFEAVLLKEITDSLSTMLSSAQAGIYSIYDFYENHSANSEKDEALARMNMKYINIVATGNQMFDEETVSATGNIPLMTYYICGGLVLFAMLFGINFYSFLRVTPPEASKRLSLSGTGCFLQGLSLYISILLSGFCAILIVAVPAVFIMSIFGLTLSIEGIVGLILTIPMLLLVGSAFIFAISSATEHNLSRILLTFFVTLIMCFVSGCFIPTIMLPDILQSVSILLPTHYMIDFASNALAGDMKASSFFICFLWAIVLFFAGILFSYLKRRKELR